MKDIMGMMGKVKEMQAKMAEMQTDLETLEATGTAGGDMVNVTLNGKFAVIGVKIDPSMFKEEEVELLEDLIVAAANDAKSRIEVIVQEKTQELTAGLPIPPGMKLPF